MLRLFVLLTALVCCNACRFEKNNQDTTGSAEPGCSDSDGNHHEVHSEWENGPETCICVDSGIICCEKFGDSTVPPIPVDNTVLPIHVDNTVLPIHVDNTVLPIHVDNTVLPIPVDNTVPPIPESTPGIIVEYFGAFTENDVVETEEHSDLLAAEVVAEDSHESAEDSHESAEDSE